MVRSRLKIFIIILILLSAFSLYSYSQPSLLSMNVAAVQKMTINSGNRSSELTPENDKDLITRIYKLINSTKTRIDSYEQTSEPEYTITIDYANGSQDTIYSTETGEFIYKRLVGNGWVGGKNERLDDLINVRFIW